MAQGDGVVVVRAPTVVGLFGFVLLTAVTPVGFAVARSFRYETTWVDAGGATHTLRFHGDITRGAVTGEARLDGQVLAVRGTVHTDGTLSGTVADPGGRTVATLRATPESDGALAGTITRIGPARPLAWRLPGVRLPAATDP